MVSKKKLIEVALPLEKINAESAREKSIRHGHPSTLHLWWARRPLAAARAVIWSSLVDDPSSHPELFPTEEDQNNERQRLFKILEDLVVWENSNNEAVLNLAKVEIMKSTNNDPPALLDPFAGGGAIPLEAQRLGLEAHAHDLNPVAVMINKAMIELPPRFANKAPVNPDAREKLDFNENGWKGATGLAEDVRYYGEWMKKEAFKLIGHLYPKVKVPQSQGGGEATVVAWFWARTAKCPNPACGCDMPLVGSFVLSKKKGKEAWIECSFDKEFHFEVHHSRFPQSAELGTKYVGETGKGKKGTFVCQRCKTGIINRTEVDSQANRGNMGVIPMAIVVEGNNNKEYLSVDEASISSILNEVENYYESKAIDELVPHAKTRGTFASNAQGGYYGFLEFKDYFTKRQQIMLSTFATLVHDVKEKVLEDGVNAGQKNDHISLSDGGSGLTAYSEAVATYFSFIIDKLADYHSSICSWHNGRDNISHTFGRQAIPMVWDFVEANPFSNSSGCFDNMLDWVYRCLIELPASTLGFAEQADAQSDNGLRDVMVSTDPPYYDNVCYSDLADYFYVWMRESLKQIYPSLFSTMLVPKVEELIANPYRFNGSREDAKAFFEDGMSLACKTIYASSRDDIPVTIYYAYKQSDGNEPDKASASSGWETMLSAIIRAGFSITGTWPMRTEMITGLKGNVNALASSIVLVCRKRPLDSPICTRRNFINELKRELRPALQKLQSSNIAPVDLAQCAIGPGMGVYSKYAQVLEADGTSMSVRSALKVINQELDLYFNEQDGELDSESRFCVELYSQVAFNDMKFGDANTLATAKNTSVAILASHGTLYAQKGVVHLIERSELPHEIDQKEDSIWMLCQQLTCRMEKEGVEGCARVVSDMFGTNAERAKDLAYRLYTIADQKKWAQEAYAYNSLVVAWPEIQSRAAGLKAYVPEQMQLLDVLGE